MKAARASATLALFGAAASAGILPYVTELHPGLMARVSVPPALFYLAQFVQAFLILGFMAWCGLRLAPTLGLKVDWPRENLARASLAGALTALILLAVDQVLFPRPAAPDIALWKRLLASFYGGITEEIICRLFLMTVIVWLCWRFAPRRGPTPADWAFWTGITGASLLFALGHLPAAATLSPLTFAAFARVLLLNSFGGMVFGWLYWRFGLGHAIVAHFSADLVLHGMLG
jgi:hypothetical protein